MAVSIDLFDVLLMELSNNLSNDNLRSLKHVCRNYLNENQRETVKHGLEVFEILRKRDVVTAERDRIGNLLIIITAMRPKRKDLIRKVESFIIKNHVDFPEAGVDVINFPEKKELEDSYSSKEGNAIDSKDNTERSRSANFNWLPQPRCCTVELCCCACNCYSVRVPPCFYASLSVLMILLTIFAVLAWYADVPRVHHFLTEDTERKIAGKYVIPLLVLIAIAFFVLFIWARRTGKSQLEGFSALHPDYGSINRSKTGPYMQEAINSLLGDESLAKNISEQQNNSYSTSGFSSRVSSQLSTPPYFMYPQASVGQFCKQSICAGGYNASNGVPAVPRIRDNHIPAHGIDETISSSRRQSHWPKSMHKLKDEFVAGISDQACGEWLDSDVEPDPGSQVPQRSTVKENKSSSQSFSSGIFFSVANDEDVDSYTEEKERNSDWY